jgi:MFS transporter, NNP family, nitrate/nitrite transporter
MKQLIGSLKSGNWKALLACFLYFDTGFTTWVMFGPLAPFISKQLTLTPTQAGFLVAVPVLAASIVRVTLGNLFQSVSGRKLALLSISLSSIPAFVLLLPVTPTYTLLLILGVFLGIGGASFAVALPMAGSSYPPRVQGLVLGLAAAGNIGAVLDGFLFPGLAQEFGWQRATVAVLPLLALAAVTVFFWAEDRSAKSNDAKRAYIGSAMAFVGLIALVLLVDGGLFGQGKAGQLLLPVFGSALALAVLPRKYLAVLTERDTWVIMLVYSITFGGFVGMSSYVSLLLTTQYGLSKLDAGFVMAGLSFTGAMVRPVGGWVADRVSGVRVLLVLLVAIAICNVSFCRAHASARRRRGAAVRPVCLLRAGEWGHLPAGTASLAGKDWDHDGHHRRRRWHRRLLPPRRDGDRQRNHWQLPDGLRDVWRAGDSRVRARSHVASAVAGMGAPARERVVGD